MEKWQYFSCSFNQAVKFSISSSSYYYLMDNYQLEVFPCGSAEKKSACNVGDKGPEDPLEEEWQHTPVFWAGKPHGQKSLVGYSQSMGLQKSQSQLSN